MHEVRANSFPLIVQLLVLLSQNEKVDPKIPHQSAVDFTDDLNIARYIFDSQSANQQGGTGKTFNWSLIPENLKHKIILAGGISPDNIEQAIKQGCLGADLNSGVETAAGVKDSEKLRSVFKTILSN